MRFSPLLIGELLATLHRCHPLVNCSQVSVPFLSGSCSRRGGADSSGADKLSFSPLLIGELLATNLQFLELRKFSLGFSPLLIGELLATEVPSQILPGQGPFRSPSYRGVARDAGALDTAITPGTRFSPLLIGELLATKMGGGSSRSSDSFQSPSYRGVARDHSGDVLRVLHLQFQSPSYRGVARDGTDSLPEGWRAFCFSPLLIGELLATLMHWPLAPRSNIVSVPFLSGSCSRQLRQSAYLVWYLVSVPFLSGSCSRLPGQASSARRPNEFQSPSYRGVARDNFGAVDLQGGVLFQSPSYRGVARDFRQPTSAYPTTLRFSPLLIGELLATR